MGNTCNNISSRFGQSYQLQNKLGKGEFSIVYKCKRKKDDRLFAIKIIDKKNYTKDHIESLKQEVNILQLIKHPNIVEMVDIYNNKHKTKMILELCDNGDLLYKMHHSPNGIINELNSAKIVYKLAKTLKYLHSHGVVHRDLKPQNILFTKNNILKITDFGMSHFIDYKYEKHFKTHLMKTQCGTPYYAAPEVLNTFKYYNQKIDYWSLGVILYFILTGIQPFQCGHNLPKMYNKIIRGKYHFNYIQFNSISSECKDLITNLININVNDRYICDDIVTHSWIKKYINCKSDDIIINEIPKLELEMTLKRQSSLGRLVIDNYIINQ